MVATPSMASYDKPVGPIRYSTLASDNRPERTRWRSPLASRDFERSARGDTAPPIRRSVRRRSPPTARHPPGCRVAEEWNAPARREKPRQRQGSWRRAPQWLPDASVWTWTCDDLRVAWRALASRPGGGNALCVLSDPVRERLGHLRDAVAVRLLDHRRVLRHGIVARRRPDRHLYAVDRRHALDRVIRGTGRPDSPLFGPRVR